MLYRNIHLVFSYFSDTAIDLIFCLNLYQLCATHGPNTAIHKSQTWDFMGIILWECLWFFVCNVIALSWKVNSVDDNITLPGQRPTHSRSFSRCRRNVQFYKPQCIHGENAREFPQSSKWDLGFDLLALNTVLPFISMVIQILPHLYPADLPNRHPGPSLRETHTCP